MKIASERARGKDYSVSVPPTPGASNWVQMGSIAAPGGGIISMYYVWSRNIPAEEATTTRITGRVTAILVDPTDTSIIYVGASQGGVWKTADGGRNWVPTSDYEISLSIGALAIDPTNRLVLYAGNGEGNFSVDSYYGNGILKTVDGARTWKIYGQKEFARARFCRIAINPKRPEIVFAAISSSDNPDIPSGIYRSMNGALDWAILNNGLPGPSNYGATDVIINPDNPDEAYVAFFANGLYKTKESTKSNPLWEPLTITGFDPSNCDRIAIGISPSSPNHLYAVISTQIHPQDEKYDDPNAEGVLQDKNGKRYEQEIIDQFYESNNGGGNWTRIQLPGLGTFEKVH